ncbi:2-hydroxyacid dehydrogenase [Pigmentiphaga aceris]|uniref:2-hydroxyacid dehydrogenase n=1 Tax=Pigmentiphaga aceris TaxID=1940612 RepID=A0A5C0AUQ7_9BURK|nr:2-hydroxyacid dehydrogenase [Pigmentiphaga aceris]QEI05895.1 2-hydroxyacid dehydrogenase [Pigmentiphaga aceris]
MTDTSITILQLGGWLAADIQARIPAPYVVVPVYAEKDPEPLLQAHGAQARALICTSGGVPVTAALLARLPAVELILNLGAGTETVDLDAARARGVQVLTGAGLNALDVAELAMGLMLALNRRMVVGDRDVRAGRWTADNTPVRRIAGRRAGIAGMGAIGQALARRLDAFDVTVSYFSRNPVADLPWQHVPDLVALAADVDFLFVALPGGDATYHLVNAEVLKALGPSGSLISVGRGTAVDEEALVQALQAGAIAGAGMDVFEHEPKVSQGLIDSDRTVLMPHRGGFTAEAHEAVLSLTLERLNTRFFGKL